VRKRENGRAHSKKANDRANPATRLAAYAVASETGGNGEEAARFSIPRAGSALENFLELEASGGRFSPNLGGDCSPPADLGGRC